MGTVRRVVAPAGRPYRNIGFFFLALLAMVVAGFTPPVPGTPFFGYFSRAATPVAVPMVIHLHVLVAMAWFALLSVQPFLIRAGRADLHRRLGWFSLFLIVLFTVTAVPVMKHAFENGLTQMSRNAALSMLAQPVNGLVLLLVFYALALWRRRRLHQHVACVVAASLVTATPGLARLGLYVVGGMQGILLVIVFIYATLIAFMLLAKFRYRQPVLKSPYLAIIGVFLLAHSMDVVGSQTDVWRAMAERIVAVW
ncbi:hypothetical protein [Pseudoxanthomonas sp. PXM01]|uniref:hypothetical protein n=1 Tax=Pseudoxanthomonas sp. PXM01 TaxID=2769295 RepID=UPI00177B9F58|nr:hypothetical protein [Pseudoxanthomonas sp. PXM01]MBD9470898.1 hypothetical protein [Pseudoxanthomonas sp. PXM01]